MLYLWYLLTHVSIIPLSPTVVGCNHVYFTQLITMFNPYIEQIVQQTGATPAEVRASLSPLIVTDKVARDRGYATAAEYEQALRDWLDEQ